MEPVVGIAHALRPRQLAPSGRSRQATGRSWRSPGNEGCSRMGGRLWHSFSTGGLVLGMLFFAASLTPTLLPRTFLTQGVLSGCSLTAGYGIGAFGGWLWAYMELVRFNGRFLRVTKLAAVAGCAIVAVVSLWQAARWQNSIRELN